MKKLIVIVFAIFLVFMASCTEEFFGENGVVTKVEYGGKKYLYNVEVRHSSVFHGGYILHTNHLYQVGDTIVIAGKKYR